MPQLLYVEKLTSTPADTLLAFGLANLLSGIIPTDLVSGLTITDKGDSYQITLLSPIQEDWIVGADFLILFKGLDTAKKQADLHETHREDYVRHQERNQAYFKGRVSGIEEDVLREQGITPPVIDWPVWAVVNQMSAIDTYNKLAEQWYAHRDCFSPLLEIILNLYGRRPNSLDDAEAAWKKLAKERDIRFDTQVSQLQVINPGMGKGGNRGKADGLGIGGLKGFWIPEYLKFAGLFQAGIPRNVKSSKDRKTYVLRPKALSWDTHWDVFPEFQKSLFAATAVQMDILAVLRYCQVFLQQWKQGQGKSLSRFTRGGKPGDHVAAIDVVYYKYLGSAHATMNVSTQILPDWLPTVDNNALADQYLELLEEHRRIIRMLDEKIGDDYQLLCDYRNFLSGRSLKKFYEFSHKYSKYVMRKLNARKFPHQFTIPNLEVLIMAHDSKLAPILENQGFLHIAEAIRRSTIIPQYQKSKAKNTLYEIRYGLGDKLLRHSQYPDAFIQELSQFMYDYNRENAQKSETRKQQYRSNITVEDISSIIQLIDEFGSPTVANLLVAYGYARDPKLAGEKVGTGVSNDTEEELSIAEEQ